MVRVPGALDRTVHIVDVAACLRFCIDSCPRCRFVSISEVGGDCSWYATCHEPLQTEPQWLRHKTYDTQASPRQRAHQVRAREAKRHEKQKLSRLKAFKLVRQ